MKENEKQRQRKDKTYFEMYGGAVGGRVRIVFWTCRLHQIAPIISPVLVLLLVC